MWTVVLSNPSNAMIRFRGMQMVSPNFLFFIGAGETSPQSPLTASRRALPAPAPGTAAKDFRPLAPPSPLRGGGRGGEVFASSRRDLSPQPPSPKRRGGLRTAPGHAASARP